MIKMLLFVKRKAGLTPEQFRDRYETVHAPLVIRELQYLKRYQRNFVTYAPGQPEGAFDVVVELSFENAETLKATQAQSRDPAVAKIFADDEAEFMDRATMKVVMVEERVSDIAAARAA